MARDNDAFGIPAQKLPQVLQSLQLHDTRPADHLHGRKEGGGVWGGGAWEWRGPCARRGLRATRTAVPIGTRSSPSTSAASDTTKFMNWSYLRTS
jgi:hypothetical protein